MQRHDWHDRQSTSVHFFSLTSDSLPETFVEKRQELYAGKAKSVFETDDPDRLILEFRDDTSAFDGKKVEQLARKGRVNNASMPSSWTP